ncbi:archaeosortase/exosortase family protein [Cyanobium sp. Morenito 9A2]|uniref:archaeosortase/exosortase family protein n=1 Tax=Cyanobium sp. Morenito 9A2 TaxID=2823718 RepID=UPI0020CC4A11|nr:archaeosortase/exosortase family protein [Cyanobium sp. Morenito 9A2]MCP9849808.1 exosortase/archaeosortase family protein [Cyanobium sp. Morenito 9A2]
MKPADLPLALLAGLAASQLTLMTRSGPGAGDYAIMAALVWLGGAVLLHDDRQQRGFPPAPWPLLLPGLLLLLWCLLVLSFALRLYDPLVHLLPLAALLGLALVSNASPRRRLFRQLLLLGLLPPAMLLFQALLPPEGPARLTATFSAFLLWLAGQPALAEGIVVLLPGRSLEIGQGCLGLNTISLCLGAVVVFALLLPAHRHRTLLALAAAAVLVAFVVNGLRVALLGFTDPEPAPGWWNELHGFDFWHIGLGSSLFSLLAMGGTTVLVVASLEWELRRRRSGG